MKQYRYTFIHFDLGEESVKVDGKEYSLIYCNTIADFFSLLGADGWQLVWLSDDQTLWRAIFMQEVKDENQDSK